MEVEAQRRPVGPALEAEIREAVRGLHVARAAGSGHVGAREQPHVAVELGGGHACNWGEM